MRQSILGLLVVGVSMAAPARAHHAFATEFDVNRPVTLQGKVTKVELINPHSWITIEVTGDDCKPVTWMVEGGSPNALVRRGITVSTMKHAHHGFIGAAVQRSLQRADGAGNRGMHVRKCGSGNACGKS